MIDSWHKSVLKSCVLMFVYWNTDFKKCTGLRSFAANSCKNSIHNNVILNCASLLNCQPLLIFDKYFCDSNFCYFSLNFTVVIKISLPVISVVTVNSVKIMSHSVLQLPFHEYIFFSNVCVSFEPPSIQHVLLVMNIWIDFLLLIARFWEIKTCILPKKKQTLLPSIWQGMFLVLFCGFECAISRWSYF